MHIMFDLETWGTRPGCDIRSIGAVVFDPVAGTVSDDTFYIATHNPISSIETAHGGRKYPLHRDPATVEWWGEQSDEAQAAFENPVDLREALGRFAEWYKNLCVEKNVYDITIGKLWCKGPHFDVSILAEAYHAVGLHVPWHYRAPRDMRTIADIAGISKEEEKAMFTGTPHNALDDAISQARAVIEAYKRLDHGPA